METRKPIGVFDSGVGGLTVLKELKRILPGEDYCYVGDTARVPYGERRLTEVKGFAFEVMDWLVAGGVKAMVMACNISTSVALAAAQSYYTVPVYGLINARTVRAVLAASPEHRVGLLATTGTVRSQAWQRALTAAAPDLLLTAVPCPKFVPLVEAGDNYSPAAQAAVREYVAPILAAGAQALILGCTHYPFLLELIKTEVGREVNVIDPARATAEYLRDELERRNLRNAQPKGAARYYVTGALPPFGKTVTVWLRDKAPAIESLPIPLVPPPPPGGYPVARDPAFAPGPPLPSSAGAG